MLFYSYNTVNVCWTSVQYVLFIIIVKPVFLNLKAVLLGISRENDVLDQHEIDGCNFIVTYAKWTLWKHRKVRDMIIV